MEVRFRGLFGIEIPVWVGNPFVKDAAEINTCLQRGARGVTKQ